MNTDTKPIVEYFLTAVTPCEDCKGTGFDPQYGRTYDMAGQRVGCPRCKGKGVVEYRETLLTALRRLNLALPLLPNEE
jgi:DnaJ-class molecular chaperone